MTHKSNCSIFLEVGYPSTKNQFPMQSTAVPMMLNSCEMTLYQIHFHMICHKLVSKEPVGFFFFLHSKCTSVNCKVIFSFNTWPHIKSKFSSGFTKSFKLPALALPFLFLAMQHIYIYFLRILKKLLLQLYRNSNCSMTTP